MAMNPMQRRARNSFLTGMLVTLVLMAIVVVILLAKINKLNEDKEKLMSLQKKYYVVAEDIKSGAEVTTDSIKEEIVQTTVSKDDNLTPGDFIDIRLALPSGVDLIVLAKKKVLQCDSKTIWLKMSEEEILTLNNAIVESYQAAGSKLYATTYVQAGLQESAVPTYPVNTSVMALIERDPNVVLEARNALVSRYNLQGQADSRITQIDSAVVPNNSAIQSGIQNEVTALKSAREAFVAELEGSGKIGRVDEE